MCGAYYRLMPPIPQTTETLKVNLPWEKHYTVGELAKAWHIGRTTATRWFQDEPGVLRQGEGRLRRGRKRPYVSMRIPQSVAERVYRKHLKAV
jgi:hypothetical protein